MIIADKSNKRSLSNKHESFDLVVAGGGLSGVCAAIAAARNGMRVALVQDRPVLGGNASSEVRVWALGATSHMGNNNRWAREGGIIGEILQENTFRNKEGNPIIFDSLLIEKVLNEPNISLFLNTVIFDLKMKEKEVIGSISAFNSQNSTMYEFAAPYFCDATGDGILGYLAGAAYRIGAEEKSEFKEGFSPSEEYGEVLGHTIFLYPKQTDHPVKYVAPSFALKDIQQIPKYEQITPAHKGCNYWWFEYGGLKDTIHESEEIKYELWKVVYGAWNYIKNSGVYPEAENMTLEWVGTIPGKRESRRFEGLYMLTQKDITDQTHFDDTVAFGGWAIDLHPAQGVYSPLPSCNQYHSKGIYEIPYRCYVSKDISNLFIAGRLISASHVAFGSTRVMITSGFGGQAIGAAAAQCLQEGCMPADLCQPERMMRLQQQLNLEGQSIPHRPIAQEKNKLATGNLTFSSTLRLNELPANGEWRLLVMPMAQLLPLKKGQKYTFQVQVKADEPTDLTVELAASQKPYNYTPDLLLEKKSYSLETGENTLQIAFDNTLPHDGYGFVIFRCNPLISLKMSKARVSGVLSVFNKFNKAVNNLGKQMPPEGSGFESFEFFTPERRPQGENIAMCIHPALDCFGEEAIRNGYTRPYLAPNTWVCDWNDVQPALHVSWDRMVNINQIRLYFDTDQDHPMEPIQWGHPEDVMPFCIRNYSVYNDRMELITTVEENYQSINKIVLEKPISTTGLHIRFEKPTNEMPASVCGLYIE